MILGLGADIVEIKRIENRIENEIFISHVFTDAEYKYCKSKAHSAEHFAARFAAKEAFFKALGTGVVGNLDFIQVEVTHDKNGAPNITLHDHALDMAKKLGVKTIHLSISHERNYATATVIIEKDK
mgnify:CR=1 FL=1